MIGQMTAHPDAVASAGEHARATKRAAERPDRAGWAGRLAIAAVPGALTVYLSFDAGGFFGESTGFAVAALTVALVLRITVADRPFEGLGVAAVVPLVAIGLLAAVTLASAAWSDAPARAVLEFDRTLLYLLALVLTASVASTAGLLRPAIRMTALGIGVVAVAGLVSRTLPTVLETSPNVLEDRLSYPLTYWNGLGLLAAIAIVLCLHLASDPREPRGIRVAGAGATPLLAATLILTFSRGAIAVCVLGLVAYFAIARPRLLLPALVATAPAVAAAVALAYGAELLASTDPRAPAAVDQGRDLIVLLSALAAGAALVRAALLPVDARLARISVSRRTRRISAASAGLVLAVTAAVAMVTLDLPDRLGEQYDRFLTGDVLSEEKDVRQRLTDVGNNGRRDQWQVTLDAFSDEPLLGHGAGTYQLLWAQRRDADFVVSDAHSLYLEMAAELGIVGAGLLAVTLLAILIGVAWRARGPDRAAHGALLAAGLAWALHAGIDWDWELPATTFWLFALAGFALAAPADSSATRFTSPGRTARVVVGLGLLAIAVTPVLAAVSQRRLERAVEAFKAGDCATTIDASLSSIEALSLRPEPFALLGYCDIRLGQPRLAVRLMETAVARDPANWEYRYGLAMAQAVAGADPRPAARHALRLSPRETLARDAVERFATGGPAEWRGRALRAPVPIR